MGSSTAVDTAALVAAGSAASRQSREIEAAAGASGSALGRMADELAGSQAAAAARVFRQASDGVLGDLACAVGRLGGLLSVAALQYADAEEQATVTPSTSAGSAPEGPGHGQGRAR